MKIIQVVAAVIFHEGDVLCVQRGPNKYDYISKKFEFPGGKIEVGESKIDALKREIKEELNMDILIEEEFLETIYDYPDFTISMFSFKCSTKTKDLTLKEHLNFKWLSGVKLLDLDWAAADIPIVKNILKT